MPFYRSVSAVVNLSTRSVTKGQRVLVFAGRRSEEGVLLYLEASSNLFDRTLGFKVEQWSG